MFVKRLCLAFGRIMVTKCFCSTALGLMRWNSMRGEETAVLRRQRETQDSSGASLCRGGLGSDG